MLKRPLFSRLGAAAASMALVAVALPISAAAVSSPDTLVTVGTTGNPYATNRFVFPQNKQNEPGIARDANSPKVLIGGSNEEIDLAPCTQNKTTGAGSCPFTPGVGVSGVYFSTDNGATWVQPEYSGWSARTGKGKVGPIGTLPNYFEAGLVSQGDPILAVGPKPDASGHFSWANGSRYYYANLTENFPGSATLPTQFVAVAVSHTDNLAGAMAGQNSAWSAPSIASGRLNPVLFDDKEAIWVDNAASSPFFGRAYVSWTAFRASVSSGLAGAEPIMIAHSDDGGVTWSNPVQVSSSFNNNRIGGRQGSTIRTDSQGVVYLFFEGATPQLGEVQMMSRSFNGGATFDKPTPVATVNDVGTFDPNQGRFTFDGVGGARTDSFASVDIANNAPTGTGATNLIVIGWSDAGHANPSPGTLGGEKALVQTSKDGGNTWSSPVQANPTTDRPDFTAIAVSPDGSKIFVVYDNFDAAGIANAADPRRGPRPMQGVVLSGASDLKGGFTELHRGDTGDARASSANSLVAEFIGDYNYAVAGGPGGTVTAVWNDVRNADNCQAVDEFRAQLAGLPASVANPTGADFGEDNAASAIAQTAITRPFPPKACPTAPNTTTRFGNSDIFGGTY